MASRQLDLLGAGAKSAGKKGRKVRAVAAAWRQAWRRRGRRRRRADTAGRRVAGRRGAAPLPQLRAQRHHLARAARRARRPQAGAAPHPVRDVHEPAPLPGRQATASARPSSATCWASTTRTATPRSTTRWCAWRRTSRCATPLVDGHGNFGSLDGDAAGRLPLHRVPAGAARRWSCSTSSSRRRSTSGPTTTARTEEPIVLPARFPQPAGQRLAPASRSAWRPTSRRTTWARCATRCVALIDDRKLETQGPAQVHQGPGLPDRRPDPQQQEGAARDLRDRAGRDPGARRVEARGAASAAAPTSSSRRSPTR